MPYSGPILAAFLFMGFLPRRRWKGLALFALISIVAMGVVIGCGGGTTTGSTGNNPVSNPGSTTGNYKIVVTATSSALTATTSISLTLQ